MMGREKEARTEAAEVIRINPKFSVDKWAKIIPYKDQSEIDKFVNALRKVGLKWNFENMAGAPAMEVNSQPT